MFPAQNWLAADAFMLAELVDFLESKTLEYFLFVIVLRAY